MRKLIKACAQQGIGLVVPTLQESPDKVAAWGIEWNRFFSWILRIQNG
jgi:hypothetical protein